MNYDLNFYVLLIKIKCITVKLKKFSKFLDDIIKVFVMCNKSTMTVIDFIEEFISIYNYQVYTHC